MYAMIIVSIACTVGARVVVNTFWEIFFQVILIGAEWLGVLAFAAWIVSRIAVRLIIGRRRWSRW
ncbi:hypothetical protein D4765_12920 [Subtercola vilae]|uniref:Uncharacterized protein n=1 Tax=Subtercola vilae TaxID=2056433 RepID=A0A4V4RFU6_9MICO|nr:hypothetical protein D4765_12920 [Subtercola vilae]